MNNKKSILILPIIIVFIIIGVLFLNLNNKKEKEQSIKLENEIIDQNNRLNENINNSVINEKINNEINQIKKDYNISGDSNLYEISTEYDGRKVLNVKENVQYKVAFAGIIKQEIPKLNEVDSIFHDNYPTKKGIWIEKNSRNSILKLLEQSTKSKYSITEEGYLFIESNQEQNENDKNLEKLIDTDRTIILTVNSFYYEIDTITGEVVEYPFEKLDSYQSYDYLKLNSDVIIFVTSNSKNKLTNTEILKEILMIDI